MHRTYDPPFTQSPAPNTLLPHLLPDVLPLLCRVPPGTTMSGQMLAPSLLRPHVLPDQSGGGLIPACLERGSGSGGSGGGAAGTGPGSSTMSGEWRPGRCHPPRPLRLSPLQLHTPAPESLRTACLRTPSRRSQFPDPCTPRSWPLVTCTFLECRVQAFLVP